MTIMEEGSEFLERLPEIKESGLPMFTSCCPGWINHIEKNCPDMIPHISSTRSPQAIFGALAKTWLPKTLGHSRGTHSIDLDHALHGRRRTRPRASFSSTVANRTWISCSRSRSLRPCSTVAGSTS